MEIEQSTMRSMRLFLVLLLVMLGITVIFSNTVRSAPLAADFSTSSKTVNLSNVELGNTVRYTLLVANSGDANASGIFVTDTLPAGLSYVNSSYSAAPTNNVVTDSHSASANSVTWNGTINSGHQIAISFDVMVGGAITVGDSITNSFVIDYNSSLITNSVSITASADSPTGPLHLPLILKRIGTPTLAVSDPAASGFQFAWTASWNTPNGATGYTIQESADPTFASVASQYNVASASKVFAHDASPNNVYYYRVQSTNGDMKSSWSNVVRVVGAYHADFTTGDPNNLDWKIRREDRDDTNNTVSFPGISLKLDIDGRWDYALASPLKEAPKLPYRIETRVKYEGVANLNTYGIIWGGNWNGLPCPVAGRTATTMPEDMIPASSKVHDILSGNDRAPQGYFDNCFESYYRAMFLWSGPSNVLRTQVKRIYQHNDNNSGQGIDVYPWSELPVSSGNNQDFNIWKIDVLADGSMKLWSGDNLVAEFDDNALIHQPYFGFFASSDEYPGADPLFEYLTIKPLP
ncbi:MAG: DUF11 domain-containing protein [Candidatus Promineifilaceae bacterium]